MVALLVLARAAAMIFVLAILAGFAFKVAFAIWFVNWARMT